ncbi:MAG: antibiotic biosynthesis monooxygenase [Chloroflexi bacterium]|nr:antibiotic biosynthesis monooxygenase [Chloroflexota bacterium]
MIGAIFVMKTKPGHREHFIEALKEHGRAATATEPGLRRFDIYPDQEEPDWIWFAEGYVDRDALDSHLKGPSHIEKWVEFGREHCVAEWPPTMSTGMTESIWTSLDGD